MNVKTFVFKLVIFAVLFVVADQLAGFGFEKLNSIAGDKFAREEYMRHDMNADIIMLGSSKCTHHYVPSIFKDSLGMTAYNCGQRGNGIIYEYGRLQTIYDRYTPKVVIMDFIEGYDVSINDNSRYLDFLKVDYGHNVKVDSIFYSVDNFAPYKMFFQSYRYNSTVCDLLINTVLRNRGRFTADGYCPLEGVMEEQKKTDIKKTSSTPLNIDELKLTYINRLAEEQKENCKLVFVFSPSFGGTNPAFVNLIKDIANKNHITFLDYSNIEGISDNNNFFKDGVHMNDAGARVFSSMLAHDLKRKLIFTD